jgi:hypothetical protein
VLQIWDLLPESVKVADHVPGMLGRADGSTILLGSDSRRGKP